MNSCWRGLLPFSVFWVSLSVIFVSPSLSFEDGSKWLVASLPCLILPETSMMALLSAVSSLLPFSCKFCFSSIQSVFPIWFSRQLDQSVNLSDSIDLFIGDWESFCLLHFQIILFLFLIRSLEYKCWSFSCLYSQCVSDGATRLSSKASLASTTSGFNLSSLRNSPRNSPRLYVSMAIANLRWWWLCLWWWWWWWFFRLFAFSVAKTIVKIHFWSGGFGWPVWTFCVQANVVWASLRRLDLVVLQWFLLNIWYHVVYRLLGCVYVSGLIIFLFLQLGWFLLLALNLSLILFPAQWSLLYRFTLLTMLL